MSPDPLTAAELDVLTYLVEYFDVGRTMGDIGRRMRHQRWNTDLGARRAIVASLERRGLLRKGPRRNGMATLFPSMPDAREALRAAWRAGGPPPTPRPLSADAVRMLAYFVARGEAGATRTDLGRRDSHHGWSMGTTRRRVALAELDRRGLVERDWLTGRPLVWVRTARAAA